MNKSEVIQYFERHLARVRWNWYGTLSFRRRDIPFWMADRAFHEWKAYVWEQNLEDNGRWVEVTERDAKGTNIRFHVFISGLSVESKWPWVLHWPEVVAGDADIIYGSTSTPVRYLTSTLLPSSRFELKCDYY